MVHHSVEVQKELVDFVLAKSRKEAVVKFNIEESTIRSWVRKFERRVGHPSVEKPLKKDYIQKRWSPEVKRQVVELAKTKSRKEIQEQLNVPGPTIR